MTSSGQRIMPRLIFVVDDDSYFCSHRLHLGRAARQAGYEVLVATRVERHGKLIEDEGFTLLPIRLRRGMQSPLQDLASLWELIRLYRREKPDLVHHVALKMVLFGAIAARVVGVPARVHAITGLGHLFHGGTRKSSLLRSVLKPVLKWGMKGRGSVVILQNDEDCNDLVRFGVIDKSQAVIIRGAGVDTAQFRPSAEPEGPPVVVLPARMLRDKGVGEFVEAARLLRAKDIQARFVLVGAIDTYNPSSFTEAQLQEWVKEGIVEWWGHRDDMLNVYAASHIVVLPSYYEGLPKVLLEAAACSRPLIATRVRGCQEVVRSGDNGFLVPLKDSLALADAILTLIRDQSLRTRMGARARTIAMQEFACEQIAEQTLQVYRDVGVPSGRWSSACSS